MVEYFKIKPELNEEQNTWPVACKLFMFSLFFF